MTINRKQQHQPTDLAGFRQQLSEKKGKAYWRSLNELANSPDFEETVRTEFPRQAGLLDFLNRRDFLKVLGASLALAGMTACAPQDAEKIIPYVKPPEELVPAKPIFFASAMVLDGFAQGTLIETTMGRPIKVDGNPSHPASMGASDVFMQASILDLYDPDRARQVTNQGAPKTWADFTAALGGMLGAGAGLRILSGVVTSPSLLAQASALLAKYPQAKWVQYSPIGRNNTSAGTTMAFGQPLEPVYHFDAADVILSLDCDFLFAEPGHIRYARDFSSRHQPISTNGTMNRLYMVESSASVTGSNADHRLAVKPSQVESFARALAAKLGLDVPASAGDVPGADWLEPLAADLKKAGAAALVVVGERQPPAVHALAHMINQVLGGLGKTVTWVASPYTVVPPAGTPSAPPQNVDQNASLNALTSELMGGQVDLLVILGNNPVYSTPVDLKFGEAVQKAKASVYLGMNLNETAALASWVIPAANDLEAWGDARAFDGTVTLIQPVIEPIYGGKSALELISAILGQPDAKGYDLVRQYWQGMVKETNFETVWREALSKGMAPVASVAAINQDMTMKNAPAASALPANGLEIVFEPDPTIWDGRYANNAWMQELPKPLTKLTWDNAALVSPATAAQLGVNDDDVITLKLRGASVDAAVLIQPGQPDDVVVISLGYGRKTGGSVLAGTGFNAYAIRNSAALWFDGGLEVTKTGGTYPLALTHEHFTMENRDLVREATVAEYQANPKFAQADAEEPYTLYGEEAYPGYSWGMSINLNTCIGCNACVVACQAENNIPTVGKEQVRNSREMHWLRIDRYYTGSKARPHVVYQPVPCMHCDKAPCEPVCPVEATSHSAEGINEMTYNRCVGTRYCSNNCPYKVRRFNFFKYADDTTPALKALRNPDVSVRSRGVMEKCTYCVQRVNEVRIQAEVDGRKIADGEVKTACQQACPTNAIVFGNMNDTNSQVRALKESPLNYGLLAELGTRPRTTYLAKVKNPNPMMKEQA